MSAPIVDPRQARVARIAARAACVTVAGVGVLVLAGWALDVEPLKRVLPGRVPMNPVTAIGFVFAAASLWILCGIEAGPGWRSRQFANVLALVVILLGGQRLLGYVTNWQFVLDRALFHDLAAVVLPRRRVEASA